MGVLDFKLQHGLKVAGGDDGPALYFDVALRELTAADIIDAQIEAEQVIVQNGRAMAYVSDVRMGLGLMRRQIESIGEMNGPIDIKLLRRLHPDDLALLQAKTRELDLALAQEIADRGRE